MRKKIVLFLIVVFILIFVYFMYIRNINNSIKKIYINKDNKIVVELEYDFITECYIGNSLDNVKWKLMENKKCILDYTDSKYVFLKNKYDKVIKYNNKKLVKLIELNVKDDDIYLAVGGKEKIEYSYELIGDTSEIVKFNSENILIATISNEGVITGVSPGKTTISLEYLDQVKRIDVTVTDKIITYGQDYDYSRNYLECGAFSKDDNDLLDRILEDRIDSVGYKTRAGVVAAARFITLEFPYRINYFSENGRLHPYGAGAKIDGEGRFYHKGLYLDSSRFNIIESSMYGPATWGCYMYSFPSDGMRRNGFDCSGFISWIIYNGGYECEDLGAGVSVIPDMTDLGEKKLLSESLDNKIIKAGDLLSGDFQEGGHIALVAGIKDNNYYVAESLWFGGNENGAQIKKYTPQSLMNNFYWHVDMENYYNEDGEYTEFWLD